LAWPASRQLSKPAYDGLHNLAVGLGSSFASKALINVSNENLRAPQHLVYVDSQQRVGVDNNVFPTIIVTMDHGSMYIYSSKIKT